MFLFFSFLFGLIVGSFLNVILFRYSPQAVEENPGLTLGQVVRGRSCCLQCGKLLKWYELIPLVSFLFQKGRCRHCKKKLSWQYPVVEFLSGSAFLAVSWKFTSLFPFHLGLPVFIPQLWVLGLTVLWWLVFAVLIAIAVYDFKYFLIPNVFLSLLVFFALAVNLFYLVLRQQARLLPETGILFSGQLLYYTGGVLFSPWRALVGMVFGFAIIGGLFVLSKGKAMGFGDLLLIAALGLLFGWPDILLVLFLSFISGALVSLPLLMMKKKRLKDIVPFGPFLVFAALTVFLAGDRIIAVYLSTFPELFL